MISKDELKSVEPKKRLVAFRGIARYVIEKISEAEDFSGHMLDDLESIIDGMAENYAEYHHVGFKFLMQSNYVSDSKERKMHWDIILLMMSSDSVHDSAKNIKRLSDSLEFIYGLDEYEVEGVFRQILLGK